MCDVSIYAVMTQFKKLTMAVVLKTCCASPMQLPAFFFLECRLGKKCSKSMDNGAM